jgi:nitrogen fixation NifU-like protein
MTHSLYTELVLEHQQHPRHRAVFEGTPTHLGEGKNPNCGDHVKLALSLDEGTHVVQCLKWSGEGCALCMASASMMAEWANREHPTREAFQQRSQQVRAFLRGERKGGDLGKYQTFASVCKHPSRVKCAALPWMALESALA